MLKMTNEEITTDFYEVEELYFGTLSEVKALYKALTRAWKRGATDCFPLFEDFPKMREKKLYVLSITKESDFEPVGCFKIITFETAKRVLGF